MNRSVLNYGADQRLASGSENNWNGQLWSEENLDLNNFRFGDTIELQNLVEDKAIAAQAVAFVVNSTRKGLVSLCADVAHLMRAKASLEKKVTNLRHENEALRAATQHSFVDHSQFSSQLPSDDVRSDYHSQSASKESSRANSASKLYSEQPRARRSPKLHRTRAFKSSSKLPIATDVDSSKDLVFPEFSNSGAKSNATVTRETQCNLTEDAATDCEPAAVADTEQFRKAMLLNIQLAEELAAAKRDIETLQSRFCELETKRAAEQFADKLHIETERQSTDGVRPNRLSASTLASRLLCDDLEEQMV